MIPFLGMTFVRTLFFLLIASSLTALEYHSQVGQDQYVNDHFFHNMREGIFVDIGAYDGVTGSNSLFFEKELGWSGICVEPVPHFFQKLEKSRSCTCINSCIGEDGSKDFLWIEGPNEQLSGLLENYSTERKELLDRLAIDYHDKHHTIQVTSVDLMDLLQKHNLNRIDYLSIDTEGGELEILQSIDFDQVEIRVIDVENNRDDPAFSVYLATRGYKKVARLVVDDIYIKIQENRQ